MCPCVRVCVRVCACVHAHNCPGMKGSEPRPGWNNFPQRDPQPETAGVGAPCLAPVPEKNLEEDTGSLCPW